MKTCLFILTFHHIFVKSFSYYFGREMYLFRIIQISHLIKNISFFQILSILTCFCIKSIRMNAFLCIRTFLISRTARKSRGLWNIIINAKSHTFHQAINKLIRILIRSFFLCPFFQSTLMYTSTISAFDLRTFFFHSRKDRVLTAVSSCLQQGPVHKHKLRKKIFFHLFQHLP